MKSLLAKDVYLRFLCEIMNIIVFYHKHNIIKEMTHVANRRQRNCVTRYKHATEYDLEIEFFIQKFNELTDLRLK